MILANGALVAQAPQTGDYFLEGCAPFWVV